MVENEEKDDQDSLIEELTPTLHEESQDDIPASVKFVILLAASDRFALHGGGRSHGIFTTNTDTVEELRETVANDPAFKIGTPSGGQHDKTDY